MHLELLHRWGRFAPAGCRRAVDALGPWERSRARELLTSLRPLDLSPAVGVAWFPVLAEHGPDEVEGGLLRIRTDGSGHRELASEPVRNAVIAAIGLDSPPELAAVQLRMEHPPEGQDVTGRSWELAAALACVSALLGRPDEAPRIVSGRLDHERPGWLLPVRGVAEKRRIAALEGPGAEAFVVDQTVELASVLDLAFGRTWRAELLDRGAHSPYALVQEARQRMFGGPDGQRSAQRLAEAALETGAEGPVAGVARWVLGVMAVHRGHAESGLEHLDAAAASLAEADHDFGDHDAALVDVSRAVALLDLGRPRAAAELLGPRLDRARVAALKRTRDERDLILRAAGTLHRARVALGDDAGALAALDVALEEGRAPAERCRHLLDRAEVHRRHDRLDEARRDLTAAAQHLADVGREQRGSTLRFLELYRARAGVSAPRWNVEPADWHAWPQPAEVLERLVTEGTEALDAWIEDQVADDAPTVHRLVALGAAARAHRRHGVSSTQAARLVATLTTSGVEDTVAVALARLLAGDPEPWVRRTMY